MLYFNRPIRCSGRQFYDFFMLCSLSMMVILNFKLVSVEITADLVRRFVLWNKTLKILFL